MSNKVHKELLFLYRSALDSVTGRKVLPNFLHITSDGVLRVAPSPVFCSNPIVQEYDLKSRRLVVVGAGKSVLGLTEGFLEFVDAHNTSQKNVVSVGKGILSVPFGMNVPSKSLFEKHNIQLLFGAKHNIPDEDSVKATRRIVELIESLNNADQKYLVVNFISGGGSALLALPKVGITLERKREIIEKLVKAGSTIEELNKVRRVLSDVKGGKLLRKITNFPNVEMVTFIASDIIGDPIELIASGPTVPVIGDAVVQAMEVVKKRGLRLSKEEEEVISRGEENQKNEEMKPSNFIVVSNVTALSEVTKVASSKLDYEVVFLGNKIEGEAKDVAVNLANYVRSYKSLSGRNLLFLGGGETTVTFNNDDSNPGVGNPGVGGRCQEMALAFFTESFSWSENVTFMAVGSDGQDGPTFVAGVITNSGGLNLITRDEDASKLLANCCEGLKYHDSHNFWRNHDPTCFIDTGGPTGVNVMDLYFFVKESGNHSSRL